MVTVIHPSGISTALVVVGLPASLTTVLTAGVEQILKL